MKKILPILALISLIPLNTNAKVTPLADWQSDLSSRVNEPQENTITCEEKCDGYSITTTYCYGYGEVLEACPVTGCSYYFKCVPQQ